MRFIERSMRNRMHHVRLVKFTPIFSVSFTRNLGKYDSRIINQLYTENLYFDLNPIWA